MRFRAVAVAGLRGLSGFCDEAHVQTLQDNVQDMHRHAQFAEASWILLHSKSLNRHASCLVLQALKAPHTQTSAPASRKREATLELAQLTLRLPASQTSWAFAAVEVSWPLNQTSY